MLIAAAAARVLRIDNSDPRLAGPRSMMRMMRMVAFTKIISYESSVLVLRMLFLLHTPYEVLVRILCVLLQSGW